MNKLCLSRLNGLFVQNSLNFLLIILFLLKKNLSLFERVLQTKANSLTNYLINFKHFDYGKKHVTRNDHRRDERSQWRLLFF